MPVLKNHIHKFVDRFRLKLILILSFMSVSMTHQQPDIAPEYQVKAVFLYNFTQFVEWPPSAFASADSPLVIGILGKDPFGKFIDETIQGESFNGHPLLVKRLSSVDETQSCHIVFINQPDKVKLKETIDILNGKSILTVSDANNFAKLGGMVRFVTENRKTRLRINLEATRNANLTISSKLLRLAEIVTTEK